MIKKLLIGAGLVTLGYLLGKAVGRSRKVSRRRLTWSGDLDPEPRRLAHQVEPDAEFEAVAPARPTADSTLS
jgi:hypothetical protein